MDCVTHFNEQLETVQESIKWYMYVQHPHAHNGESTGN